MVYSFLSGVLIFKKNIIMKNHGISFLKCPRIILFSLYLLNKSLNFYKKHILCFFWNFLDMKKYIYKYTSLVLDLLLDYLNINLIFHQFSDLLLESILFMLFVIKLCTFLIRTGVIQKYLWINVRSVLCKIYLLPDLLTCFYCVIGNPHYLSSLPIS